MEFKFGAYILLTFCEVIFPVLLEGVLVQMACLLSEFFSRVCVRACVRVSSVVSTYNLTVRTETVYFPPWIPGFFLSSVSAVLS